MSSWSRRADNGGDQLVAVGEREHAGQTTQFGVNSCHRIGDDRRIAEQRERSVEAGEQRRTALAWGAETAD